MKKFFLFQRYTCFVSSLILTSMFLSGCFSKQKLHRNALTKYREKPRRYIIEEQNIDITNLNVCADWDITMLRKTSVEGNLDLITLLLKNGTKVDTKDKEGKTALMYAEENGHLNIVQLLLDKVSLINNLIFCLTKNDTTFFENAVDSTIRKENDFFEKDKSKNLITLLNICKYDENDKRISKIYNELHVKGRIEKLALLRFCIQEDHLLLFSFLVNNDGTMALAVCNNTEIIMQIILQKSPNTIKDSFY